MVNLLQKIYKELTGYIFAYSDLLVCLLVFAYILFPSFFNFFIDPISSFFFAAVLLIILLSRAGAGIFMLLIAFIEYAEKKLFEYSAYRFLIQPLKSLNNLLISVLISSFEGLALLSITIIPLAFACFSAAVCNNHMLQSGPLAEAAKKAFEPILASGLVKIPPNSETGLFIIVLLFFAYSHLSLFLIKRFNFSILRMHPKGRSLDKWIQRIRGEEPD